MVGPIATGLPAVRGQEHHSTIGLRGESTPEERWVRSGVLRRVKPIFDPLSAERWRGRRFQLVEETQVALGSLASDFGVQPAVDGPRNTGCSRMLIWLPSLGLDSHAMSDPI